MRFMMAAKRPVRYTCTIWLVRDHKFGDWIKPLCVRWSRIISALWYFGDAMRSLRQSMSLMICSTSHRQRVRSHRQSSSALVGGWSCTCVFDWTSLEPFFSLVLHFMLYSVITVTGAFWALLFFIIIIYLFSFPPLSFVVLFCGKLWRLFFLFFL